jgi:hypothetical protein
MKEIKLLSGKWMERHEIINLTYNFIKLKSNEVKMLQLFLPIPDCGTYFPKAALKKKGTEKRGE